MKRVILAVVAALSLFSCTSVESFGACWDKGIVDPALEGTWKKTGLPGEKIESIPGADMLRFTNAGGTYETLAINPIDPAEPPDVRAREQADNERPSDVRTLRIGGARLMMVRAPGGDGKGIMLRYDIQGTTLREYWIDEDRALAFLAINHPQAKNIRRNVGEGAYVVIGTFDDEVFQVLSEMTASSSYWRLNCEYQKMPGPPIQ